MFVYVNYKREALSFIKYLLKSLTISLFLIAAEKDDIFSAKKKFFPTEKKKFGRHGYSNDRLLNIYPTENSGNLGRNVNGKITAEQ